jgi:hypothetical protein
MKKDLWGNGFIQSLPALDQHELGVFGTNFDAYELPKASCFYPIGISRLGKTRTPSVPSVPLAKRVVSLWL